MLVSESHQRGAVIVWSYDAEDPTSDLNFQEILCMIKIPHRDLLIRPTSNVTGRAMVLSIFSTQSHLCRSYRYAAHLYESILQFQLGEPATPLS